jgi:hypothetical protein
MRDVGTCLRLYDRTWEDCGLVHAPPPVEPSDLVATASGAPYRVLAVFPLEPGGIVHAVCEVERVRLPISAA